MTSNSIQTWIKIKGLRKDRSLFPLPRLLPTLGMMLLLGHPEFSQAQILTSAGPFDFESGTAGSNQFTDNFRNIGPTGETAVGQTNPTTGEPGNDYAFSSATSAAAVTSLLFDTSPISGVLDPTFAGSLTITLDISGVQADSSFGIQLLDGGSTNNLLALFNLDNSGTTDRIRFFGTALLRRGRLGHKLEQPWMVPRA
ncbi:MAG: hypothetical protein HC904_00960 [Blastochloris sp.]|nr:hypothetical protein [Blastochloris sp.]